MEKRRLIKILCWIVGPIGLLVGGFIAFVPDTFQMTRPELQAIVAEQLPIEADDVTVDDVTLEFVGNEVAINANLHGEKYRQAFTLTLTAVGVPDYSPGSGSFYFRPSSVEIVEYSLSAGEGSITNTLTNMASRYLPGNVGAVNLANDIGETVENRLPEIAEQAAVYALQRVPVYTLPRDAVGIAAMAVLNDVSIENDNLVVDFTLWRLTWWVLLMLFAVVASIGMAAALAHSPGLFAGVVVIGALGP